MWDKERTRNACDLQDLVLLRPTLSHNGWLLPSAHCSSELIIWAKFHENPFKGCERYGADTNMGSSGHTLTLSQSNLPLPSAHKFSELNIQTVFHAHPSKYEAYMNEKHDWMFLPSSVTLSLRYKWLTRAFCSLSQWAEHVAQV